MDWQVKNNSLYKEFVFSDFNEAWGFMTEVATLAAGQNHHPEWSNTYNVVKIRLTTHDVGNLVTEKDWRLARAIDELLNTQC